jgi:GT2 family glycosyltransferase
MAAVSGQARESSVARRTANIARRVIAFGCSILMPDVYRRAAEPGIRRAAEPDSVILANAGTGSVARSLNLLLDQAAGLRDLEALVLVHEDAELLDADFPARLRDALSDPDVAIVGCVGARGVRDIAWWDGTVTWNSAAYHHAGVDGGQVTFPPVTDPSAGEVDVVYGVMMALSPWAVTHLRFDESVGMLHGYDFDACRQARAAGRRVVTADLRVAHHHSLDLVSQIEIWVGAHMRAAELWDEEGPASDSPDEAWRARARAGEASAAAARLLAASKLLHADASAQRDERILESIRSSLSWRMTEPLRRGNALVRRLRARGEPPG